MCERERARTDLEAREMSRQQDRTVPALQSALQVLQTLHRRQPTDACITAPPRHRRLEDRNTETAKMCGQQPLARLPVELGQTQFEVAPCDRNETEGQPTDDRAKRSAERDEHPIRERLEHAQEREAERRRPVAGSEYREAR